MGYLLGAPSGSRDSHTSLVSAEAQRPTSAWIEVTSLERQSPHPAVAAFAIDQPQPGDRFRGLGLEINGWVLGRDVSVSRVRTSSGDLRDACVPLAVRRPDVAADYLSHPEAGSSGFSIWQPLSPGERNWQVDAEAVLANGASVPIARIRGQLAYEQRLPRLGYRAVTAPDFVIIGAQRGGTTSLHAYLCAHPQVEPATTKELHFFTERFARGRDWYLGQFPAELPPGTITGEATPYALFHPLAPRRLRELAPEARLIALLRNPVDRAYSHYLLERSRGDEPLDFAAALEAEPERLDGEEARLLRDPQYVSAAHKHASYLSRGDYARQLETWFELFPREQILVLRSEDLYERSAQTFAGVARFLDISSDAPIPFFPHNQTSGPPLDPAIRHRLSRHFAPRNERLADLLGWDPGWS